MSRFLLLSTLGVATLVSCTEYEVHPKADVEEPAIVDSDEPIDTEAPVPDPGAPVAVCDVYPNPVTPPFEKATWDGKDSYDPDGLEIVEYNWSLTQSPSGSSVAMPGGNNPKRGEFQPDLAGDYIGQLVVVNSAGVASDPCEITLESIPAQDLWVEMFWTQSGDDMDLHLLRQGGALETNGDCYYLNCANGSPEWGSAGPADNPRLDLDDIDFVGPENINITEPVNEKYTVVVHDYPGSTFQGGNNVTVRIVLNGNEVWTDTRTISGENSYTYFAEIDWTTGTVTTL